MAWTDYDTRRDDNRRSTRVLTKQPRLNLADRSSRHEGIVRNKGPPRWLSRFHGVLALFRQRPNSRHLELTENASMAYHAEDPVRPLRRTVFRAATKSLQKHICERCSTLDIARLLATEDIRTSADPTQRLHKRSYSGDGLRINLGPYRIFLSMGFQANCDLCRLLQAILPQSVTNPSEDLYLIPASVLCRVEPDIRVDFFENGRHDYIGRYTNVLYLSQHLTINGVRRRLCYADEVQDAIGLVSGVPETTMMAVRQVAARTPDVSLILDWILHCRERHKRTCINPQLRDWWRVRLIDVAKRKVVQFPRVDCDYVCLSYVWGSTLQPRFDSHSILPRLPQTLEDACDFVGRLGQRYLWIDSICIDQTNEVEKTAQISMMDQIYKGALLTLVALSGDSAEAGLPRASTYGNTSRWQIPKCQTHGRIGSLELMTVLPTLQQQVKTSIWASRSWTYQEALLSPRCLFFTAEQIYFECNAMQCCESLDDSTSAYHRSSQSKLDSLAFGCACHDTTEHALGRGIFRNPMAGAKDQGKRAFVKHRQYHYDEIVTKYSQRNMKFQSDALAACSAVLLELQQAGFKDKFIWGLPKEILGQALMWNLKGVGNRRFSFPSWSWVGWEGELERALPTWSEPVRPSGNPTFLAWYFGRGEWRLLTYYDFETMIPPYYRGLGTDPIYDALQRRSRRLPFDESLFSQDDLSKLLLIEGLIVTIPLRGRRSVRHIDEMTAQKRQDYENNGDATAGPWLGFTIQGEEFYLECRNYHVLRRLLNMSRVDLLLIERFKPRVYDFLVIKRTGWGTAVRLECTRLRASDSFPDGYESTRKLFADNGATLEYIALE